MTIRHALLSATYLASLAGPALAQTNAAPAAAAPAAQRSGQLEEIVVTAQRREERLQTTPVSVSAFTGDSLANRQVSNTLQLNDFVPNLQMQEGTSSPTTLTLSMRGLGEQSGGIATTESPVGIYIDDVFQGRLAGANVQFSDIERIEFLRGPQGTLFGRNAQAGAINVISRTPGDEIYGNASIGYGNYERVIAKGAVGGPIIANVLSASAAIVFQDQGRGTKLNTVRNIREEQEDYWGVRTKLRYTGIDNFDAVLTFWHNAARNDGLVMAPMAATTLAPITRSYFRTQQPIDSFGKVFTTSVSANLAYDFGWAELRSITAWQNLRDGWRFDLSGGIVRPNGQVVAGLDRTSGIFQQQWTQELRLSGLAFDDRLNWIVGGFYYTENAQQRVFDRITNGFTGFAFNQPPRLYGTNNESWAGFAQGTFEVTEQLSVTAGLRYTTEDKRINGVFNAPFRNNTSYNAWTPRFGIEYRVNEDVFLFASASRGFRAGGYSGFGGSAIGISTPYAPETVWSYEAGSKVDLFDSRVRLNTTAFLANYKALQAQILTAGALPVIQNAFDMDVWGLELEAQAVLIEGVTLSVTLGLQDLKIKNANPTTDFVTFRPVPTRPLQTPKYNAAIGIDVDTPLAKLGVGMPGFFLAGADLTLRDKVFANNNNNLFAKNRPQRRINAYIGYKSEDERWRATLSGRNLTDREDWVGGFAPGVFAGVQGSRNVLDPFMWMAEISYRF